MTRWSWLPLRYRPEPLWDGVTRAEAVRRLLALSDEPARLWPRGRWIARLAVAWAALRALWRR